MSRGLFPMETLVLVGASLIDGTGAEPVRGRAVVVEGDRITQVVDDARAPKGRRIDLSGCTLLPGLINCHVHLCFGAEADPVRVMKDEPHALTALKMLRRAQETVEAGVTTVRDLGGRDYAEFAVRRAIAEGLFLGPRILGAGRPVCMTGGHGNSIGREADGPDDARKAVREQLKAGADVIKLIATGGVMTPGVEPGSPQLTLEEMRAAIEEAMKACRRTAAQAQSSTGIADAVVTAHVASFRRAHQAGAQIAAGADSGTPLNFHGSLLPELELMVKYGMTPLEAIRSATSVAAEALGFGGETGRLAEGHAADLLAVTGDPAERIGALSDVRLVLARGAIIRSS